MWLSHFFMKKSVSSALNMWLASKCKARTRVAYTGKITILTPYLQVLNYFVMTFIPDENIADTQVKIIKLIQPSNKAPSQDAKELVAKRFRCKEVYEEQNFHEISLEGQEKCITKCLRG